VCEVKVSGAPVEHEGDQLLVLEVLLQHHERYQLRDVVLEVVSLLASVDHGVYALVGQFGVYGIQVLVLVEFV
jgi:hypothetical protein